MFFCLMIRLPPRSTRTDTLFPYTTLFRSASIAPLTVHPPKISQRLADYATVRLSADLSGLDADQKKMLALLIEAADVTNALYWRQNWGDRDALLARIDDPQQRAFAALNSGTWDRLHVDKSFVAGIGPRPRCNERRIGKEGVITGKN